MGGYQLKEKSPKLPERKFPDNGIYPLRNDLITIGNIFASLVETGCESQTTPVGHKASLLVHSSWLGAWLGTFHHKASLLVFFKPESDPLLLNLSNLTKIIFR